MGTVVGEYEVEALLGHGGYSVVYRARHVELEHVVALKEYFPADLATRDGVTVYPRSTESTPHYRDGSRRFLEEAKRIIQFKDDPGVVAYLGFFRANGTAYLVLEHVDGMSLAELLRKREGAGRPLSESELRSLVLPLVESLARLHKADVLHRDIKPSNVLVRRPDGRPVLIDFGASKQQAALHSKSAAPFTEGYAAWEQVGEGDLGPWTDVYALGAVMWRVVAGNKPPWDPPNPKKVELRAAALLAGNRDPLPSAVELGKGRFSPNLLGIIDACLAIRATERIPNCDELRNAIEGAATTAELPIAPPVAQARLSGETSRPVRARSKVCLNYVWEFSGAITATATGIYVGSEIDIPGVGIVEIFVGAALGAFVWSIADALVRTILRVGQRPGLSVLARTLVWSLLWAILGAIGGDVEAAKMNDLADLVEAGGMSDFIKVERRNAVKWVGGYALGYGIMGALARLAGHCLWRSIARLADGSNRRS